MPVSPFSLRDRQRLTNIHPDLITRLEAVFAEMAELRSPMFVAMGVRTTMQQAEEYAKGRTAPGPDPTHSNPLGRIVTYCDGIIHRSNHQLHDDGFGHAVDCAFQGADPFGEHQPWERFGVKSEAVDLKWGGRWTHPYDRPHVELP